MILSKTTTKAAPNQGMAFIIAAALIWGTIGASVRLLYTQAPADPLGVGFLRLLIAAPALILLGWAMVGPHFWRVQHRDLWVVALMGSTFAGYQVSYFAAIAHIGVAAAVMINICSAPIFTAILARIFLGESLSRMTLLALVGAVLGTALLVGGVPQQGALPVLLSGAALALTAGFSYSIVVLTGRVLAPRYHPIQPITLAFTLGAVLLAPVVALSGNLYLGYSPWGWGILIYLGVVPTAIAYVLYLHGMRTTSATITAILTLLEPLGSTLLAILFLGERLAPLGIGGIILLLGSMGLLYKKA